jgi:thiamine-phosphate pyrophosphorylase
MPGAVRGLYAVTPDLADTDALLVQVDAALAGGTRIVQYRNKTGGDTLKLEQARALAALCRRHRIPLIINDHLELALAVDADGLHLGSDDGPVAEARSRLGPDKLLGVSCYDRIDNALDAARLGANYLAFGSFFPSRVKPGAVRAPLSLLSEARRRSDLPLVAIGGITADNAPELIAAGADALAVISALFAAPDITAAARRLSELFVGRRKP